MYGFFAGFPNFHEADYGDGVVYGTILLRDTEAEWRDVLRSDLGNPHIDDVPALVRAFAARPSVRCEGLMCIPPEGAPPRAFFDNLAKLAMSEGLGTLSMGMSGDFEIAILEGATIVRVGSALFEGIET